MLAIIRKFAQSWVAMLLFIPLTISFLVFGVRDVLHPKFTDAVVQAGSHEISPSVFKRDFEVALQSAKQQTGQDLSVSDAIAAGYDQQILSEIEGQVALNEYLTRAGIVPSEHLVDLEINEAPRFANALGQFDQTLLDEWLGEQGISALELKSDIRDDIALRQTAAGLAAGLQTPKIYGALLASYNLEGRAISYFVLDPHSAPVPAPPTDAQLQALIDQHTAQLTRPEMRTLSVVRFSAAALAPSMPVDETKVQSLYDAAKSTQSQPEKRSLIEFTTADAVKAQTIAARLKAGDSPDSIGKALGVTPATLDDRAKGDVVDPAVADPAFAASQGQVLGPIKSGLAGYAVVKLVKITPALTPTLAQLRPQLEAQVRQNAAIQKVFDAVKTYEDAHNSGANLADSARAAGATPVTVGPITADGRDQQAQAVPGVSPKLLKEAFSLSQGGESEMEDDGEGEYFAVRVLKIAPPAVPALAEIRPQLVQAYMQEAMLDRLNALATQLTQKIQHGESLEAAAASAHAQVKALPEVTRAALVQGRQMDPQVISALFNAKKGDVVSGRVGQVQVIVARVDGILPATGEQAARQTVLASQQFNDALLRDMIAAARTTAVAVVKPEGDLAAARQALGVSQDETAQSGARPKRGPAL
ncbi:MAG TPA: peptidyl-prolyl cis-trans isomerase [Caulobacteraceae bacterium]|nr:peptidyl-prolyl cis-trans isomerase [Caulobacteraceae bacterium]